MRSCFALIFQVIFVNKDLKYAVWDSIPRGTSGTLFFRTVQGASTNYINYYTTKFLPLTLIAIVNNLSPLVTVVLAFFLLKERITKFEMWITILMVSCVIIVVLSENPSSTTVQAQTDHLVTTLLYASLLINPVLIASGSIAMR